MFNVLKATEAEISVTIKVYGLAFGPGHGWQGCYSHLLRLGQYKPSGPSPDPLAVYKHC